MFYGIILVNRMIKPILKIFAKVSFSKAGKYLLLFCLSMYLNQIPDLVLVD